MYLAMLTIELQDNTKEKIVMTYEEYVEFFQNIGSLHVLDVYKITGGDYYITNIINCKHITKRAAEEAKLQTQQKIQQKTVVDALVKHYRYSSVVIKDGGDYLC